MYICMFVGVCVFYLKLHGRNLLLWDYVPSYKTQAWMYISKHVSCYLFFFYPFIVFSVPFPSCHYCRIFSKQKTIREDFCNNIFTCFTYYFVDIVKNKNMYMMKKFFFPSGTVGNKTWNWTKIKLELN